MYKEGKSLHIKSYVILNKKSKENHVGFDKAVPQLYVGSASKSGHTCGYSIK